LFSVI